MAGRVGEISGSVFAAGEHRKPGGMAHASCRGAAAGVGGRADQPAFRTTGSSAAVGFGANRAEPASGHPVWSVAVRVCSARPGVVAALAARPCGPAKGIAPASGFADTSDVHAVAPGAWSIWDLPADPDPAGGYRRTTHNGSIRVGPRTRVVPRPKARQPGRRGSYAGRSAVLVPSPGVVDSGSTGGRTGAGVR